MSRPISQLNNSSPAYRLLAVVIASHRVRRGVEQGSMLRWLYTLVVLTLCAFAQNNDALPKFHGTYEELLPQQKKLIDEWYAEYNAMTGDHASPTEYSCDFSLSTKTTFQATTDALMTTRLD